MPNEDEDTIVTAIDPANPDLGNSRYTMWEAIVHLNDCIDVYLKVMHGQKLEIQRLREVCRKYVGEGDILADGARDGGKSEPTADFNLNPNA